MNLMDKIEEHAREHHVPALIADEDRQLYFIGKYHCLISGDKYLYQFVDNLGDMPYREFSRHQLNKLRVEALE